MSQILESVAHSEKKFFPSAAFSQAAHIPDFATYQKLYAESLADPEKFWGNLAKDFFWFEPWTKVCEESFISPIQVRWFVGGKTNVAYNCLDRHVLAGLGERTAILWEGNDPGESRALTYRELLANVCCLANLLSRWGVKKGDRVAICMPMIPELAVSLLACARLGAVHSVIFAGFSAESLKDRILDSGAKVLITADAFMRGTKKIALKKICDEALELAAKQNHRVARCLIYRRLDGDVSMHPERDAWWHETVDAEKSDSPAVVVDAEDPLFILYTSGSTGKPKGVMHTTAGYMVYAAATFKYVFDYRPQDIFWCTADIGWVTGHSYVVYGPLAHAATVLMFEGVPQHPHWARFWEIIDKYQVTIFYTAPTAIRALAREGEELPKKYRLTSLRLLGSVGEPINPEAWLWYHEHIGHERCPIVDTWWQTETGGILITTLPGAMPAKPGSAGLPFFGVRPQIVREDGSRCEIGEGGSLILAGSWPGMMRTVYGDHARFEKTYFSTFRGCYFSGDGCHQDEDGYYWFMGRIDDVLNVAGHRLGTAEIESALVSHPAVAEAAVVGFPHAIKGQGIYAYVLLNEDVIEQAGLEKKLAEHVRREIGAIATPDVIHIAAQLPKTRSGKIMRRILRKIAAGEIHDLGDVTTLADPSVVEALVASRQKS